MATTESAKEYTKASAAKTLKDDAREETVAAPQPNQKFLPTGLSRALVLASIIMSITISATLLFANRYDLVPAPNSVNGFMYRIDRLSGGVQFCGPQGCSPLPHAAE